MRDGASQSQQARTFPKQQKAAPFLGSGSLTDKLVVHPGAPRTMARVNSPAAAQNPPGNCETKSPGLPFRDS
jgi:hypothetical protein